MTFRPDQIGDHGQQFAVWYRDDEQVEHPLGYASTREGAEKLVEAWRKHPAEYEVWIIDRFEKLPCP